MIRKEEREKTKKCVPGIELCGSLFWQMSYLHSCHHPPSSVNGCNHLLREDSLSLFLLSRETIWSKHEEIRSENGPVHDKDVRRHPSNHL